MFAGACKGGDDGDGGKRAGGPDATATLRQSAQAMGAVQSVALALSTEDKPQIPVRGGDIKLLKSGDAEGTIQLAQAGQTVEMNLVALGDAFYIKAVTGGWRKLPKAMAATMYDPSAVLDPQRGISKLLTSVSGAKTEATEEVAGKDAHRIAVTLPREALGDLVPGINQDVPGKVWVSAADHRLLRVRGDLPAEGGGKASVTIDFTEFDKPYQIAAPA